MLRPICRSPRTRTFQSAGRVLGAHPSGRQDRRQPDRGPHIAQSSIHGSPNRKSPAEVQSNDISAATPSATGTLNPVAGVTHESPGCGTVSSGTKKIEVLSQAGGIEQVELTPVPQQVKGPPPSQDRPPVAAAIAPPRSSARRLLAIEYRLRGWPSLLLMLFDLVVEQHGQ